VIESQSSTPKGDPEMDKQELLERYEALGGERDFLQAKPLYVQALAAAPEARDLNGHGYLLYAHARRELRQAVQVAELWRAMQPAHARVFGRRPPACAIWPAPRLANASSTSPPAQASRLWLRPTELVQPAVFSPPTSRRACSQ
jgi:hypothetical protein